MWSHRQLTSSAKAHYCAPHAAMLTYRKQEEDLPTDLETLVFIPHLFIYHFKSHKRLGYIWSCNNVDEEAHHKRRTI